MMQSRALILMLMMDRLPMFLNANWCRKAWSSYVMALLLNSSENEISGTKRWFVQYQNTKERRKPPDKPKKRKTQPSASNTKLAPIKWFWHARASQRNCQDKCAISYWKLPWAVMFKWRLWSALPTLQAWSNSPARMATLTHIEQLNLLFRDRQQRAVCADTR